MVLLSDRVTTPHTCGQAITMDSQRRGQTAPEPSTLFVSSVAKGFDVLAAVRRGQAELGLRDLSLSEIARLANMDKSAAQRFSNTLVQLGYLSKDPVTRRYRPGVKLADLYYTYMRGNRLAETAMPRLIEASKNFGTTVNLCELSGTDIIYTIRIPHERARYEATLPGRRVPAFCTAGGNVILANLTDQERETVLAASDLKALTPHTVCEPDAISRRIEQARANGYDIGVSQAIMDEISTAAPVFNSERRIVAAVQIPVYKPQWTVKEARRRIVPLAMETARAISGSL